MCNLSPIGFMNKIAIALSLVVVLVISEASLAVAAEAANNNAPSAAGRYIRLPAAPPVTAPDEATAGEAMSVPREQAPECSWIGHRVVLALLRDDVLAADGFRQFYASFGCPTAFLGRAFGCAVPYADEEATLLMQYVDACWRDPNHATAAVVPAEDTAPAGDTDATEPAAATPSEEAPAAPAAPGVEGKSDTTYPKR